MSSWVTSSTQLLEIAYKDELASINDMLSIAGIENNVEPDYGKDQLSRENAEALERKELSEALAKNASLATATAARVAHEANRAIRDITIATATHKALRMSIYNTMYQRKLQLEKDLQEERYV